jgi:membrane-associated phospholipid phosphatase
MVIVHMKGRHSRSFFSGPAVRTMQAMRIRDVQAAILLLWCGSIFISGCGTMHNGRGWGQDATLSPGWDRVGQAALKAATAPETWGPAAGALAFQIGHADRNVAEWAAKSTPVYGSQKNAANASDDLLKVAGALWVVSGVAAPSGDTVEDWAINKAKGFGIEIGTGILMRETVGYVKSATDRTRPNGYGTGSFPSAHASGTALYATLTSKNLEAFDWSDNAMIASRLGLGALTAATAWARVEANEHYPSDVLAGIALGHFFGAFFTDAFLGLDNPRKTLVLFEPSRNGAVAKIRFDY